MCAATTGFMSDKFSTNTHKGYKDEDESSSDTVTSEPSRDSSTIHSCMKHHSLSFDSNSSSQMHLSKDITVIRPSGRVESIQTANQKDTIEKQLREILKKLPPVQSITAIESQYVAELIPCTCKIIEIFPRNNVLYEPVKTHSTDNETVDKIPSGEHVRESVSADQTGDASVMKLEIVRGSILTAGVIEPQLISSRSRSPLPVEIKPKKSIFDFDFDEDEDPLNSLKAEAAVASLKKESVQKNINTAIKSALDANHLNINSIGQTQSADNKMPLEQILCRSVNQKAFPMYEIEEDPLCLAKQRFDVQTQMITKFHLNALHNCLVPNVNGNWDVRLLNEIEKTADYRITDYYNVVPNYGSVTVEHIRQNLNQITLSKTFKSKKAESSIEEFSFVPFLGVAHSALISSTRKTSVNHKKWIETNDADLGYKSVEDISSASHVAYKKPDNRYKTTYTTQITSGENAKTTTSLVKSHGVTCSTVNTKIKSELDVTVDLTGHCTDFFQSHSNNVNASGGSSQNLLRIADQMDNNAYPSAKPTNLPSLFNENVETDIESQKICYQYRKEPTFGSDITNDITKSLKYSLTKKLPSDATKICPVSTISPSSNISECSNLNQDQYPINLKLKRKFQEKMLDFNFEGKRRRKKCNRRHFLNEIKGDNAVENNEPKRKRNKIAINGDMVTKIQISGSSRNNSSDEGNRKQHADRYIDNDAGVDEVIVDEEDDDSELTKRIGNNAFRNEQFNLSCNEKEIVTKVGDDFDKDVEFNKYEDSGDFCSDIQEVVARDISVPSTSNNHVVVTIKATPSTTDSPCRSFNATFPVIVSDNMISSQMDITVSTTTFTKDTASSSITHPKIDQNSGILRFKQGDVIQDIEIMSPKNSYDIKNLASTSSVSSRSTYKERRNLNRRCKSKIPKTVMECPQEKHHRQLFFPHEVVIKDHDGIKQSILNFSSCSSSCTEYSEHEYSNDSCITVVTCEPKINPQTRSESQSKLGTSVNETYETKTLRNFVQLWKRLSPSSTTQLSSYSNDSTIEHNNELSSDADHKNEGDRVINEYTEQSINFNQLLTTDSNEQDNHILAGTTNIHFPNGHNNFCNKNMNDNSITYYINEPSLFKHVNCSQHNGESMEDQQKINNIDIGENTNIDAHKSIINVCSMQTKHKTDDRSEHNFNFCDQNYGKSITELSTSPSCKEQATPLNQGYLTGISAVVENVDDSNDDRLQLFSEWHQLLQLRSYNDELLTVLPYVVFD